MRQPEGNIVTAASWEKLSHLPSSSLYPSQDMSTASSTSSPHSAIQCFLFQFTLSFHFLDVIKQLLMPSYSSYCPFYLSAVTCFRRCEKEKRSRIVLVRVECYFSSLTVCNASSFLTPSVQIVSSILPQHHTSKPPRYFRSSFRSIRVLVPYNVMFQNVALHKFLP